MKTGRRFLKSKRAISGAVTALILVIVSVALALAVAVFAFGLFGSFGSSGNLQVVGTTYVYNITNNKYSKYNLEVILTVKNPSSNPASIDSITVGNTTFTSFSVKGISSSAQIPAGASGQVIIYNLNSNTTVGGISPSNVGGSIPITLSVTEGTLSPTITINGIYEGTNASIA